MITIQHWLLQMKPTVSLTLSISGAHEVVKHARLHVFYEWSSVCSLSPPTAVLVPVKARILKLVVLPSLLVAHGVCTLTAASTHEAKCRESSGYRENTLKRYSSRESCLFTSIVWVHMYANEKINIIFFILKFFSLLVLFRIASVNFKIPLYSFVWPVIHVFIIRRKNSGITSSFWQLRWLLCTSN